MCQIMEDLRLEAEEQTLLDSIRKMMKNLQLNADKAMAVLEIPEKQQKRLAARLLAISNLHKGNGRLTVTHESLTNRFYSRIFHE